MADGHEQAGAARMPEGVEARGGAGLLVWSSFCALAAIWGSSFLFIKIGLDEGLRPLTLVTLRLAFATALLVVVMRLIGGRLPGSRDAWRRLTILAMLNVAIPFVLITWGAQFIPSAVTTIFNSTVPLFAIVIAALVLRDEPITLNRLGGLAIGFLGTVLLASPHLGAESGVRDGTMALIGEVAVTAGSFAYALSAVYIRHAITSRPLIDDPRTGPRAPTPVEIALPQVFLAGVVTGMLAIVLERPSDGLVAVPSSPAAWLAVGWLGTLGSGIAYLLLFKIVTSLGATRTTLVTYLMPVVGIPLGIVVLHEQLFVAELLGAILIIGGLILANSSVGQRRLFGRSVAPSPAPRCSE